jgi:hypothetical protein
MALDKISLLTEPGEIPEDRATIPDDTLINIYVWAALQGITKSSADSIRTRSNRRRKEGQPKAGDMPAEDQKIGPSPYWKMSTYRAWEKSRPGKGAGGGRPKGTKNPPRPPKVLKLPAACPHCHREIRSEDLPPVLAGEEPFPALEEASTEDGPGRRAELNASVT